MTNLYTNFVSRLVFPVQERLKGHHSVEKLQQLEQSQWLNAAELEALQSENLKRFMRQVYDHVPYYRRLLDDAGLKPESIGSASALAQLPFLTKALIQENTAELKAANAQQLKPFNTGGSSGSPLIFYLNTERVSHDVAAKRRATRWWDVDIGDKEIVAWGSPIELTSQDKVRALRDKLMRTELIPAFNLGEQQIRRFIERIREFQPTMLFGYPSVYDLIARHAESADIKLNDLGIRVAFVTSEKLYDHQRGNIERVFGCPVANGYGGRDAGFIAHQCPNGGMHISAEDIIVEIVAPDGSVLPAGESGEIVVTHTATSAFPFVRYRTGDIGTISTRPCGCGRGLPVLEKIEGRTTDFVVAKNGTVMHGLALIYVLREIPSISEFKIVQESVDRTVIDICLRNGSLTDELVAAIQAKIRQRLGESVDVAVQEVERIDPEKSGKYRYVKSLVDISVQ